VVSFLCPFSRRYPVNPRPSQNTRIHNQRNQRTLCTVHRLRRLTQITGRVLSCMSAQGTETETTTKSNKSNKFLFFLDFLYFFYFFDFAVNSFPASPYPSQITSPVICAVMYGAICVIYGNFFVGGHLVGGVSGVSPAWTGGSGKRGGQRRRGLGLPL
jgi:hypothetical protein